MIKLTIFLISLICLCFSGTRLIGIAALVLMCYAYPWMLIVLMALAFGVWRVVLEVEVWLTKKTPSS
jgi:hypothetical protein